MSKAQLERFISLVSGDPTVLQHASQGEEDLHTCARNVVQYAKAQGYDFSEDEAREWLAERSEGELRDSQLDAVAGGAGYIKMPKPGDAVGGPSPHMMPGAAAPLGSYDLGLGSRIEGKH